MVKFDEKGYNRFMDKQKRKIVNREMDYILSYCDFTDTQQKVIVTALRSCFVDGMCAVIYWNDK